MSDGNASGDSGRQKRTRFATPEAPSEATIKKTRGPPIAAAQDHVDSHAGTLHDKLAKFVVRCAADFMTWPQNLHYKIASQQKLKTDKEYIPKSAQIKLELSVEKGTNKGEAFQALQEKHSQVLIECQLKLKSLVIEAGDLDLIEKTRGSPIAAAREHVNSHAGTLHDKLAKIVVRCAADFMTRRHNLHYKIASQQKLKTDKEYIPKSSQIKLELSVEKGTKEGEAFHALQENHSQVLIECQQKLKSLVIEAGDLDLIEKVSVPPFPSWSQSTTSLKDSSPTTTVRTSLPTSAL